MCTPHAHTDCLSVAPSFSSIPVKAQKLQISTSFMERVFWLVLSVVSQLIPAHTCVCCQRLQTSCRQISSTYPFLGDGHRIELGVPRLLRIQRGLVDVLPHDFYHGDLSSTGSAEGSLRTAVVASTPSACNCCWRGQGGRTQGTESKGAEIPNEAGRWHSGRQFIGRTPAPHELMVAPTPLRPPPSYYSVSLKYVVHVSKLVRISGQAAGVFKKLEAGCFACARF